jgi:hypothetical protein
MKTPSPTLGTKLGRNCLTVLSATASCRLSAVVPGLSPAKMELSGPAPRTTQASVFPLSPSGKRSFWVSDGCTWTERTSRASRNLRSKGNRLKSSERLPRISLGNSTISCLRVRPSNGPLTTLLAKSSRSLRIQASPMGPFPGSGLATIFAKRRPPQRRYWKIGSKRRGYSGTGEPKLKTSAPEVFCSAESDCWSTDRG